MKTDHFNNFIVLATGILCNRKGEVLLIKRSRNNKTFRGFWQLPEGKIEFGEQPVEALAREIKEELGCRLTSTQPATASSAIVNFQGVSYHLLRICFNVGWKGVIKLSKEHENHRWVNIQEVSKLPKLVPGTKEIIKTLKKID